MSVMHACICVARSAGPTLHAHVQLSSCTTNRMYKHDRSRGDSHPLCICCCVYTLSVAEPNSILEHSALPPTDNKTGLQHEECIRCNFQTKPRPIGPDKIVAGAIGGAGRDGRRVDGTKPWIIVAGSIGGAGISDQGQ